MKAEQTDWLVDERLSGLGGEGRSQDDSEVFGLSHWRKELPMTEREEGGRSGCGRRKSGETQVQFQAC